MRLKDIREESELKQFTVSKLLGVKRGTYSLWELELDVIPLKRLITFCAYFNCSVDYALGLSNKKNYEGNQKEINRNLSHQRLKELRLKKKYTQAYLAKKLSLNRSLISKYEKGHILISTTFLIEYAKLFHISTDYLLGKINKKIIINDFEKVFKETY